jgi:hypothetical protein
MTKLDEMRIFFKRLPKDKFVSIRQVEDKFDVKYSTAFVHMKYLQKELKLKTTLMPIIKDNGREYISRVFYK